jgi:hypothetical protein
MVVPLSILVLGAGELGVAILESLANDINRQDTAITVMLRSSSLSSQDITKKKQHAYLKFLGIELQAGDVEKDSIQDLVSIFKQYNTIISCTGMELPPGSQIKVAKAILEAGVPRYFPWQWGVDYDSIGANSAQDLFDEQLEVRKMLRAQTKTNWIIVSTGLFMSFLFMPAFGPVDLSNSVVRGLGSWDTKVTVTTPKDIGTMTAEIVYKPEGISHQVVFIGGDTVSYGEVADIVENRYKRPFAREEWSLEYLQYKLAENPDDVMIKYQNVFGEGRGVAWGLDHTLNVARGIKMVGIEDYITGLEK